MRIMGEYLEVGVTSRNVLRGNLPPGPWQPGQEFRPDYSIFTDPNHPVMVSARRLGKSFVVSKEEFGHDHRRGTKELNQANFKIFPDDNAILQSRPVFNFRDPHRTFDSWLAKGWDNIESFLISYQNSLDTFEAARKLRPETVFYTHETLVQSRENQVSIFQDICTDWGIKFDPKTLEFSGPFGVSFIYRDDREQAIYSSNPKDLFTRLIESGSIRPSLPPHGLLNDSHRELIDKTLIKRYSAIHSEVMARYNRPSAPLVKPEGFVP